MLSPRRTSAIRPTTSTRRADGQHDQHRRHLTDKRDDAAVHGHLQRTGRTPRPSSPHASQSQPAASQAPHPRNDHPDQPLRRLRHQLHRQRQHHRHHRHQHRNHPPRPLQRRLNRRPSRQHHDRHPQRRPDLHLRHNRANRHDDQPAGGRAESDQCSDAAVYCHFQRACQHCGCGRSEVRRHDKQSDWDADGGHGHADQPVGGFATSYTVNVSTTGVDRRRNGSVRLDLTSVGSIADQATNAMVATHNGDQTSPTTPPSRPSTRSTSRLRPRPTTIRCRSLSPSASPSIRRPSSRHGSGSRPAA